MTPFKVQFLMDGHWIDVITGCVLSRDYCEGYVDSKTFATIGDGYRVVNGDTGEVVYERGVEKEES